jgi:hypothetical protein
MLNRKMREKGYTIPAKPTDYGPYHFRSKLEAQWAVFMDCLGVKYIYEPKVGEVEAGCRTYYYNPDFELPSLECYIEIKPRKPIEDELGKGAGLANLLGRVFFFYNFSPNTGAYLMQESNNMRYLSDDYYYWCECPRCSKIDILDFGQPRCGCYTASELVDMDAEFTTTENKLPTIQFHKTKNILQAYNIARKHKFDSTKKVQPLRREKLLY